MLCLCLLLGTESRVGLIQENKRKRSTRGRGRGRGKKKAADKLTYLFDFIVLVSQLVCCDFAISFLLKKYSLSQISCIQTLQQVH